MTLGVGTRDNKLLLKQLHDTGFPGGPTAIDRFFGAGYMAHGAWEDLDGLKTILGSFLAAYPAAEWVVEDMVAEADKVAVRALIRIRTAGGIARTIGSTSIYRISNNRIVEQWSHGDPLF